MTEKPRRKVAAKPPVSAHPAFPAIVALWFAALLGLGSLVLPVTLFEHLSEATGLSGLFVAAQAPLGVTARIMIALTGAGFGVALGLFIARRLVPAGTAQSAARRPVEARPEEEGAVRTSKRPISAHEEFGEGGIDGVAPDPALREPMPGRRRALSVTDESARSEFLEIAPVPGHAASSVAEECPEPLDLAAFDAQDDAEAVPDVGEPAVQIDALVVQQAGAPRVNVSFGTSSLSGPPIAGSAFAVPADRRERTPAECNVVREVNAEEVTMSEFDPAPARVSQPDADSPAPVTERGSPPLGELAIAALVDRFARALEQHREDACAAAEQATQDEVVDLTFALAARSPAPEVFVDTQPASRSEPEPAFAQAIASPAPAIPVALRPYNFEDEFDGSDDDDDDFGRMAPLNLSLTRHAPERPFARPGAAFAAAEGGEGDDVEAGAGFSDEEDDEGYSSLLAMKSPHGLPREAVRIDDDDSDDAEGSAIEPVVVFPGQAARRAAPALDGPARDALPMGAVTPQARPFDAPHARADAAAQSWAPAAGETAPGRQAAGRDTESALREALEKLQKMSGAA